MLICRNVEGVHGQKKVGNPCSSAMGRRVMNEIASKPQQWLSRVEW